MWTFVSYDDWRRLDSNRPVTVKAGRRVFLSLPEVRSYLRSNNMGAYRPIEVQSLPYHGDPMVSAEDVLLASHGVVKFSSVGGVKWR